MAQNVHIIDLRRSYLPIPPDAMPVTLHTTGPEDAPEARIPVMPYDGYNFMPTPQGYSSFFGVNARLDYTTLQGVEEVPEIPAVYGPDTYDYHATTEELKDAAAEADCALFGEPWCDWDHVRLQYDPEYPNSSDIEIAVFYGFTSVADWLYSITKYRNHIITLYGARTTIPGELITPAVPAIPAVPGTTNIDDVFMIQTDHYENLIVVLAEDGIWTKRANSTGAFEQLIELDVPELHRIWSKCVIDNVIYLYRQGEAHVWLAGPDNNYIFTEATPTGVNMEGQHGIFRAGGRLAFWDSENSTGWSSITEPLEFGDAEKLSGFTIFQDIVGRIVTVLQHGDGFIIYCTRSIVGVRRNVGSPMLFQGNAIFSSNGISYRREVVVADPDTRHFAFTTQGFIEINSFVAEVVMPEIASYLKEKREPVLLKMLNGRYLCMELLNPYFNTSRVNFHDETSLGGAYSFAGASRALDNMQDPLRILRAAEQNMDSLYLYRQFSYTSRSQANNGQVPYWKDQLATIYNITMLNAWKSFSAGFFGDYLYFTQFFSPTAQQSGVPSIAGGTYIPIVPAAVGSHTPLLDQIVILITNGVIANFANAMTANENNFFTKQELLWIAEERFFKDFKKACERYDQNVVVSTSYKTWIYSNSPTLPPTVEVEPKSYGYFLDPTADAEANREYQVNEKGVSLQRSLTRLSMFKADNHIITHWQNAGTIPWRFGTVGATELTFAEALAGAPAALLAIAPSADPISVTVQQSPPAIIASAPNTSSTATALPYISGTNIYVQTNVTAGDIYEHRGTSYQTIQNKRWEYRTVDTCLYKEIGYTQIDGHGHYDLSSTFIIDDNTDEAVDHTDICVTDSNRRRRPSLNGMPFNRPALGGLAPTPVTIDGTEYDYPDREVRIPDTTITLQDGAPEPIYTNFLGSFIFDIQYKKWGKMWEDHTHLLDLFPINNIAGNQPIPYENFLPKAGCLKLDGYFYVFDQYPADSQIVFGKYGEYRKGYTDLHEIKIQHRTAMTGRLVVEGSMNGRDISPLVARSDTFTDTRQFNAGYSLSARWYNITVEGQYDLIHLEARGNRAGRR